MLIEIGKVIEVVVIGVLYEIKGMGIVCFVVLMFDVM